MCWHTVRPFSHLTPQMETEAYSCQVACQKSSTRQKLRLFDSQANFCYFIAFFLFMEKKTNNLWGGPLGSQGSRLSYRKGSMEERRVRGSRKWQAALHGQPGTSTWPGSHLVAHSHSSAEMSVPGTWGLKATYHQVLDKLELLVPEKSRLMCNSWEVLEEYFSGLQLGKEHRRVLDWLTWPDLQKNSVQSSVLMTAGLFGFDYRVYSIIIISPNWSLFAAEFFIMTARTSHLFRIWRYNQES